MANNLYRLWAQEVIKHTTSTDLDDSEGSTGVFAALVDTGTYTFAQTHQYYSSLSGVVGTDQEITTKTQALGVFDGDNCTFSSVSGSSVEAIVIYRKNAGADTTWALVAYIDTGVTGLPVTPNGGDITITWNASGIFKINTES